MTGHDTGETIVSLKGIRKSFSGNEILKGVDLEVRKGEVLAILGPSGSGKTTLLRCVNALERPDAGIVRVDGTSIDFGGKVSNKQILHLRRKTAMVFQNYNLFKNKTVLENVAQGLTVVRGIAKNEAKERALKALSSVGMSGFDDRYPVQLSGGQQQRVSIARALAIRPDVILLDEPTSALDPERVSDVNDVITRVADTGVTMILVTHEIRFARNVASRIVFMENGIILEEGTPKQVIDYPQSPRLKEFLSKIMSK
ncbi:amino acid ABC transporter ATP-binding protein [Bifidobacterium catenulatum]|uniref:amino acid ABC transporter ATP-binding protein n=1 Tax=Bifidobacterium catenulatum TaxID=1686 RepID=UPI00325A49F7